jgi:hypothetical protein
VLIATAVVETVVVEMRRKFDSWGANRGRVVWFPGSRMEGPKISPRICDGDFLFVPGKFGSTVSDDVCGVEVSFFADADDANGMADREDPKDFAFSLLADFSKAVVGVPFHDDTAVGGEKDSAAGRFNNGHRAAELHAVPNVIAKGIQFGEIAAVDG